MIHLFHRKLFALSASVLILFACQKKEEPKPNIIYILADDLGYGDLGCYGQQIIKTPNIDRLSKQGMMFTQHYAGCTVSAPSRCSLMTGLHTGHSYIRGNKEIRPEGQEPLPENTFTLPKMLQQAGYATGCFGKWGLGFPGSSGDPNKQGFDEFYGYNCQRLSHRYYPYHIWHNGEKIMLEGNEDGMDTPRVYAQDLIQKKALAFIRNHKDKPFFLYVSSLLPHAELNSPKDSIYAMYEDKIEEREPYWGVDSGVNCRSGNYGTSMKPHADFAAMVTRLDAYVGQIMSELVRLGLDKNTLVIFASDNGPHMEGGADPDFFNSYGPLRGCKRDLYEGGIRVPMIAWMPGKIKEGTETGFVSAFWDMMPTFADIAQIQSPDDIDGISLLPTLFGMEGQKAHDYLYWEFHEQGGRQALRQENWKLIRQPIANKEETQIFLYDLKKDIHEDNNIADQHPEVVLDMIHKINTVRKESKLFNF